MKIPHLLLVLLSVSGHSGCLSEVTSAPFQVSAMETITLRSRPSKTSVEDCWRSIFPNTNTKCDKKCTSSPVWICINFCISLFCRAGQGSHILEKLHIHTPTHTKKKLCVWCPAYCFGFFLWGPTCKGFGAQTCRRRAMRRRSWTDDLLRQCIIISFQWEILLNRAMVIKHSENTNSTYI